MKDYACRPQLSVLKVRNFGEKFSNKRTDLNKHPGKFKHPVTSGR